MTQSVTQTLTLTAIASSKLLKDMVGPNGLEPSTSSVSRKRSNQTELRAYMGTVLILILRAASNSGNVWLSLPSMGNHSHIPSYH